MMAKKALLFDDIKYYYAILSDADPRNCKALGKLVRNFDSTKWNSCREEIVFHANLAKFGQNAALKKKLLETGDAILAEASPLDKTWGIGLDAADERAKQPENGRERICWEKR